MIPLHVLFGKPERAQLRISPLEQWLGWTARDSKGVLNLWVQQREPAGKPEQVTFAQNRDACVLFRFSADDRSLLYLADPEHGSELYHLFAIDLDGADRVSRDLTADPKLTVAIGFIGNVQLWTPPQTPREVLIATGGGSLFWDVSRVNIDTGERAIVALNPMSTWAGKARIATGSLWVLAVRFLTCGCYVPASPRVPLTWFPDKQWSFSGRAEVSLPDLCLHFSVQQRSGKWHSLQRIEFGDLNMQLVGSGGGSGLMRMDFNSDATTVDIHTCIGRDTTRLVRYDAHTGREISVLANVADCDISGFLTDPKSGAAQAVLFENEKPRWHVLDETVAPDIDFLKDRFPNLSVSVMPRPSSDSVWVIHTSGDVETGVYYLYERKAKQITEVFRTRPALSGWPLGSMHPVRVDTRDGESCLCYLSLPPGESVEARSAPLPLVLFIHGGPNARDSWGFDPECQLLTSRGMAVLQVNYRASTGFGARWVQLGMAGAFCSTMQYDIEDAARWAIAAGVADPERLVILGGSFGGYSALWHLTLGSLRLKAAVAFCPLSAVGKAGGVGFRGDPLVAHYWRRVFGDASHDMSKAKAASPLFHVEKMSAPLLLLHGDKDPRAPRSNSDAVAEAARKAGSRGAYVSYADEGHGIRKEPNILDMWSRVERFLCQELGLPEPPAVEAKGTTASVHWEELAPR